MAARNAHWYNQNEGRAYPIDDAATCDDDRGIRLPPDLIVDCNIRWPNTLGAYAFVAAVTHTDFLVTLTIQAADSITSAGAFTPLAVVSLRKPIQPGRVVSVIPQSPGVAGWVVFGSGVTNNNYAGRFSSPTQSRITARAARSYRPLPVRSLQVKNADELLTGVVTLRASEPLVLHKEERFLDGAMRDCVVVRLVDSGGVDGFPVPAEAANITGYKATSIFSQFAGPCAGRPESNTCGCPYPVEFINAVAPNCDGVLTLEFTGCAQVAEISDIPGVAIACQFGLVDACLEAQIPSSDGYLPGEYDPANTPVPPPVVPVPEDPPGDLEYISNESLPFLACFTDALGELTTTTGLWEFSADDSPTLACPIVYVPYPVSESISMSTSVSVSTSERAITPIGSYRTATTATRNIALFEVDTTTAYRRAVTEVKLTQGPSGAKRNAQLILNYRPHTVLPGQSVYFSAELDYDTQSFRLLYFNGTTFSTVNPASITLPGIQLEKWYRLTGTILPGVNPGDANIAIRLESITDPGIFDETLSVDVSTYQPSTGKFGVGTNRAIATFAYLRIEEAT